MRTKLLAAGAVALGTSALALATAVPASADDTIVTFTLTGGSLVISAPATADIGGSGADFSGQLGPIMVTDGRGAGDATWNSWVTSTDFTTGGETPAETLTAANDVTYWSGVATATSGTGAFEPGQEFEGSALPPTGIVAYSHVGGTGDNSATWNPTLIVSPRADSVVGDYTGTVTHSFL